jgi:hypothetical protein
MRLPYNDRSLGFKGISKKRVLDSRNVQIVSGYRSAVKSMCWMIEVIADES